MLLVRCGSLVPVGAPWNGYKPEISRGFPRKDRFQKAERRVTRMRDNAHFLIKGTIHSQLLLLLPACGAIQRTKAKRRGSVSSEYEYEPTP
jgi:hypothetical protein